MPRSEVGVMEAMEEASSADVIMFELSEGGFRDKADAL
jgi:hypothetical protein